jgi:endo-1,3-1,4-beta-glycanase ExoK
VHRVIFGRSRTAMGAFAAALLAACGQTSSTPHTSHNSSTPSLGGNSAHTLVSSGTMSTPNSSVATGGIGTTNQALGGTGSSGTTGALSSGGTVASPSGGTSATSATAGGAGGVNTGTTRAGGTSSVANSTATTRSSTPSTGGYFGTGGTHESGGISSGGSATIATSGSKASGGTSANATTTVTTASGGSGGTTAIGGSSALGGSTAATSTAAAGSSSFVLAWEDNFDAFDSSAWQLMTHSWDSNLAQFSTSNVSVAAGILSIHLTAATGDTAKPYRGVEMRSTKTITYGKVSARIRFAKGSGVISGLVTIYTPWPADNWNEIDIEHLGKTPTSSQLNCMVYTGPPVTPPVTQSVSPTEDPLVVSPGFDAESAFHQYDIEWTTVSVKVLMDGVVMRTWTKDIARMTLPQNILFTIWASNSADWAGALTSSSAPTTADIDWIRVYEWKH